MTDRPEIKIKWDTTDWIFELIGAVFLILTIGFPIYYFAELPSVIPHHFNAAGEPDGFSHKGSIWILPGIVLVMYIGMFILNRYPHIFNYPKAITEENAERQYRLATKLIRFLNVFIVVAFFYIEYSITRGALQNEGGLGPLFVPVFLAVIFGTIGWYLFRSIKK